MRLMTRCCFGAALALGLAACADGTGPAPAGGTGAAWIRTSGTAADTVGSAGDTSGKAPAAVQFAVGLPMLESYDTSYTLVQGHASEDTLYFQKQPGAAERVPFLVLSTPNDAGFADEAGSLLARGATVRLTVQVEAQHVVVHFGQEGYASSARPTTMKLLLSDLDFQRRPGTELRLWYQSDEDATWSELPAQVRAVDGSIESAVQRRSNYAVAY